MVSPHLLTLAGFWFANILFSAAPIHTGNSDTLLSSQIKSETQVQAQNMWQLYFNQNLPLKMPAKLYF